MKLLALVSLLLGACVVMPPLRAGAAAGAAAGSILVHREGDHLYEGDARLGELRVAATPLSLGDGAVDRRVDLGVGAVFDAIRTPSGLSYSVGAAGDVTWFAWRGAPASYFRWRVGPRLGAAVIDGAGGSASIALVYEYAMTTSGGGFGASTGGAFVGGSRGELAIGVAAQLEVRRVGGGDYATFTIGLEGRFPGVVGLAAPVTRQRSAPWQ